MRTRERLRTQQMCLTAMIFGRSFLPTNRITSWPLAKIKCSMGASQMALVVKNPPANAGDARDVGSISGWGNYSGGGHGNPFQCSCLRNPMDGEPGELQSVGPQRVGHD